MVVVSDTSPVLNLAAIGHLHLLEGLYSAVIIPRAVSAELASLATRRSEFASSELETLPPFLRVEPLPRSARSLANKFQRDLHAGEAEALALAVNFHADLFLVDERPARALARRRGLTTLGLLGVLVAAERCQLAPTIALLLDRLDREAHFHIGAQLRIDVLRSVGEYNF